MAIFIDPAILAQYAAEQTKGNFTALVNQCLEPLYRVAYGILGQEKVAAKAVKQTLKGFYSQMGVEAELIEETLMRSLLGRIGEQIHTPLLGDELASSMAMPQGSDAFIPRAFLDDPSIRGAIAQVFGEQEAAGRLCSILHDGMGVSVERVSHILGCSEQSVYNRIYAVRGALKRFTDALREKTGARLYSPETTGDLLLRMAPRVPKTLLPSVLNATVGAPLLNFSLSIRRALFAPKVSAAGSVQSGIAGSLLGGSAAGSVLAVSNLVIGGVVALSLWSGGTAEAAVLQMVPVTPEPSREVAVLAQVVYSPKPAAPSAPPQTLTPPPAPMPTSQPTPTPMAEESSQQSGGNPAPAPVPEPAQPTQEPLPIPEVTLTPAPTPEPEPEVTEGPSVPVETPIPSPTPGVPTATPTDFPTPTVTPSDTPTVTPSDTPTVTPSDTPTVTPSDTPTVTPSDTPTVTPIPTPTVIPTLIPSYPPTQAEILNAINTVMSVHYGDLYQLLNSNADFIPVMDMMSLFTDARYFEGLTTGKTVEEDIAAQSHSYMWTTLANDMELYSLGYITSLDVFDYHMMLFDFNDYMRTWMASQPTPTPLARMAASEEMGTQLTQETPTPPGLDTSTPTPTPPHLPMLTPPPTPTPTDSPQPQSSNPLAFFLLRLAVPVIMALLGFQ